MKKLMLALFLAAIALTSAMAINSSHASTTANISIDSSTQNFPQANVGDTIQINIDISNVQGLWAWDIADLSFNPAYLNITGASEGPFLKAADPGESMFIWASDSSLSFAKGVIPDISDALLQYKSASGSGTLVTLDFTVIALGTSQITFNQTTLDSTTNLGTVDDPNFQQIPCTTTNAQITLGPSAASPTPTPAASVSTNPSPTASDATSTPTEDSSPTVTPNSPSAPEFSAITILLLLIAATVSMLLLAKRVKINKK